MQRQYVLYFVALLCLFGAPQWASSQCSNPNAIYVIPNGTGNGSSSNPTNLTDAIILHNSNPGHNEIILSGGTYYFYQTIEIPSDINIEGGYQMVGGNWYKDPFYYTTLNIIPPFKSAFVRNVPRGLNAGHVRTVDSVQVAHIIGLDLDSVQNVTLQDININVYNPGAVTWLPTRDGFSVYGIYSYMSTNVLLNRMDITTGDAQYGGFGLDGRNGYDAYYYVAGGKEIDNTLTTDAERPVLKLLPESNVEIAGGAGGYGGLVQQMVPCASANCITNGCMPETPAPVGGTGGAGYFGNPGGAGGVCGDPCKIDCYFQTYNALVPNVGNIIGAAANALTNQSPPAVTVTQDPSGRGGTDGQNGPDGQSYTGKGLPYQGDIFFVPGTGDDGAPGGGGSGGGGGGAGGIRSLSIPSAPIGTPPIVSVPLATVGLTLQAINLAATVSGAGNDVCGAEVLNCSTPGGLGGGGGEGGEGGGGGGGGGGVFGVYSYVSHNLAVGDVTFHLGQPGAGGQGGEGGEGGEGGLGLSGRPLNPVNAAISNQGANGGHGGNGGNGGNGQDGGDGVQYETYGFGNPYLVYSADTAHACTNSVIGIIKNPQSSMVITMNGAASNVNRITNTPTYIEVSVSQPGTIHIIQSNTQHPSIYAFHDIVVNTQRTLPSFHVPTVVCTGDTVLLTPDDTTMSSYYWSVYRNGTLITSSRSKSFNFYPPIQTGNPIYWVNLQTYETCCGWSTPQSHFFYVQAPYNLTIAPFGGGTATPEFCAGEDSFRLELTGAPYSSSQPAPYNYPGVTWSTGDTSVNRIWVKDNGSYSVTYTAASGCVTHSSVFNVNTVFPLPTTTPQTTDIIGACFMDPVTLHPSDGQSWAFNFYDSPTNPYPLPNGSHVHEFNYAPYFGSGSNLQDSVVLYVAPLSDHGCTGLNRGTAVIYHEKSPPACVQPFTSYYQEIADAFCGKWVNYQVPVGMDGFCNDYVNVTRIAGPPSGYTFPVGLTTIVHRLTDMFGNYTDVTTYVQVTDTTPPVLSGILSNLNYYTDSGTCSKTLHLPQVTATDNCQINLPVNFYWSGLLTNDSVFGAGTTQLIYSATDSSGNTTTGSYTVTINDHEAPVFNCPSDKTYYITGSDTTAFTSYNKPTATDNCSMAGLSPIFVSGFGQFGNHPLGSTLEIYSVTDQAGNTATCMFNLTVRDSIPPVVACPGPIYLTTAPGLSYATVIYPTPTATDNLGGVVSIAQLSGKSSGDTAGIGVYSAIWKGTDTWGNIGSCAVQITVSDHEGPNLICPNNITTLNDNGSCGAIVNYTVAPALDNDLNYYTPSLVFGLSSGSYFPIGVNNVVYTVADAQNNKSYCSFNVTVVDTVPPVFTSACPHDTTVNINPTVCGQYVSLPLLTASDNSCITPSIGLVTGSASGYYELGTTTQQYQIRDNQGNTNFCTYRITVIDTNTLTVTCPPDITRNTDPGMCTAYIPYYGAPIITPSYNSGCFTGGILSDPGPNFPAGTTQLTYTAQANGHYAQCSFHVTVVDNEKPHITSPSNIVAEITNGACGKVINFTEPVGTDNCNNGLGTFRISGLAPGSVFPVGTTLQTYVVSDLVGHTDTARFSITVLDTVKPVILPQVNISDSTDNMCGMVVNFSEPVGTDNSSCVTTTRISGLASGDLFPLGTTTQIYVARDSSGNADTCTFTVTVSPIYPLVTNCMDNWLQPDPTGLGQVVYYPVPGVTDQHTGIPNPCPGVTVMLESGQGSGAFFTPGPHTENYQFIVHGTGDTLHCSTNVVVADFNPPIIDCGNTQTYEIVPDSGVCTATMLLPVPTVSDGLNTGPITLVHQVDYVVDTNASYTFGPGFHTVTFTAYDYSSNQSSCTYYVRVADNVQIGNPFISPMTYCENAEVNIDPQIQGYSDTLSYQWVTTDSLGNYYTYSTDKILHFDRVHLTDQKQYSFRVTDRCGNTKVGNDFLLQVTPAPATTISGLNANYCIYDTADVTVSGMPAGGILTGHGITGNKFNPAKAGIGSHTIEYSWYDTNSGCTGISSKTVVVNDTPSVSQFADTLYCINAGVISLPSANRFYSGAGISGTTFNPSIAGGGDHVLTCTMSLNGCIGKLNEHVRVNSAIPDATITAPATICEASGNYVLTTATPGGTWTGNYLSVDSLTGNASLNSRAGGYGLDTLVYTVTRNACTNRDTAFINIVDKSDSLPYTLPQFCSNDAPVQFDTTQSKLYLGLGFTLHGLFTPANVGYNGLIFYSVITTNHYGCTDTTFRLLYMRGGQLNVYPNQFICEPGDSLYIDLQSEYDSIRWWNGTGDNPKLFTDTGNYTVFLRDTMGCSGTDTVHVYQYPVPSQIVDTTAVYACPSSPALVSAVGDSSFTNYLWNNGDTTSAILVSPGTYQLTVTNWWGCQFESPPVAVSTGPDLVLPTISCPPDTNVYADAGSCSVSGLALGTPIAFDNCGLLSVTNNAPASYSVGITPVTWTVKDLSNNMNTCVQRVTVVDSIVPFFTMTPAVAFVTDTNTQDNCSTRVPDFTNLFAASDSCSSVTIAQSPTGGAFVVNGITPVAITATDASGNQVVYYMIYQSNDTVMPIIVCPGDITANTVTSSAVVNYVAPTSTGNCSNTTIIRIAGLGSGAAFPVGVTTEKYEVTDAAGASDTCSFTVTVNQVSGIIHTTGNGTLMVMPVPATDELTVNYQNSASARLNVLLKNATGQTVESDIIVNFDGYYYKTFDLSKLASGTYILEIVTDKEVVTRKVVKL